MPSEKFLHPSLAGCELPILIMLSHYFSSFLSNFSLADFEAEIQYLRYPDDKSLFHVRVSGFSSVS